MKKWEEPTMIDLEVIMTEKGGQEGSGGHNKCPLCQAPLQGNGCIKHKDDCLTLGPEGGVMPELS